MAMMLQYGVVKQRVAGLLGMLMGQGAASTESKSLFHTLDSQSVAPGGDSEYNAASTLRNEADMYKKTRALAWLLLLAVALGVFPVPTAAADEFEAELSAFVVSAMKAYGVPGAGVAVIHGDRRIVRTFGVRKAGTNWRVDGETRFAIASVTKALTADLVAASVDRGKLGWDEPVITYLPSLRLANEHTTLGVTPRDLLTHAAGFPAFEGGLLNAAGYDADELIRRLRYLPLVSELRTEAHYSNPGIFLAGTAATRALGAMTWEAAMKELLLTPLGMDATDFKSGAIDPVSNAAYPHLATSRGLISFDEIEDTSPLGPASSIITTVEDLANWLQMRVNDGLFEGHRIISKEALIEIRRPMILEKPGMAELPPITEDALYAYASGWGVFSFQNTKILEKGGARGGFRAVAIDVPEADLAIGVVCNLGLTAFPEAVRAWVLERVLGEDKGADNQASILNDQKTLNEMFGGVLDRPGKDPSVTPDRPVASYAGSYKNDLYGTISIENAESGLRWSIGPSAYGDELLPIGYNSFLMIHPKGILALPEDVVFVINEKGIATKLMTSSYGSFERIAEEGR